MDQTAGGGVLTPHQEEVHRNYEVFKRLLPSLLSEHRGQSALMRRGEVVGFYGTFEEGYATGLERYGLEGWSLQLVTDEPVCVPSVWEVA